VEDDKSNDFACYRLGYALHGAGKLDEAIEYHERATKFPATKGIGNYNWGCALSLQGKPDEAMEKLEAAVENGFLPLSAYENDPDLENVRSTEAFQELLTKVRKAVEGESALADQDADETPMPDTEMEEPPPYALGLEMRVGEDGEGVFVERVVPGSAAERDGLQPGDRLVKANDRELADDPLAVLRPLLKTDKPIAFQVERAGEYVNVDVTPSRRDSEDAQEAPMDEPPMPDEDDGDDEEAEEVEETDESDAEAMEPSPFFLGVAMRVEGGEGVFVEELLPDGAAGRDGLEVGDRLVKANGKELGDDPIAVLRPILMKGDKISFEIERDGETMTVDVKPNPR
jgi:C-terminal processing protease CtpA/Prc